MGFALLSQTQSSFQKGTAEKGEHRSKVPLVPSCSCGTSVGCQCCSPTCDQQGLGLRAPCPRSSGAPWSRPLPVCPPMDPDIHTQPRVAGSLRRSLRCVPTEPWQYPQKATGTKQHGHQAWEHVASALCETPDSPAGKSPAQPLVARTRPGSGGKLLSFLTAVCSPPRGLMHEDRTVPPPWCP